MTEDKYINIIREVFRQDLKKKPKLSKKTSESFNLAACFLPVLYNLIYKRFLLAGCFVILTCIPHILDRFVSSEIYLFIVWIVSIISLILAVYSGKTGNKDAYDARNYDDEFDFLKSQQGWFYIALLALIAHIIVFPIQVNGHYNTSRMIALADAKQELKEAIVKGEKNEDIVGSSAVGDNIPSFFAQYIDGSFDGTSKITSKKGYIYDIEGYEYDCLTREATSYHESKTACAKVKIDINGNKGPNAKANSENSDSISAIAQNTKRLNDIFVLYIYSNDLAPKEGSIEQYAFKKFERK